MKPEIQIEINQRRTRKWYKTKERTKMAIDNLPNDSYVIMTFSEYNKIFQKIISYLDMQINSLEIVRTERQKDKEHLGIYIYGEKIRLLKQMKDWMLKKFEGVSK